MRRHIGRYTGIGYLILSSGAERDNVGYAIDEYRTFVEGPRKTPVPSLTGVEGTISGLTDAEMRAFERQEMTLVLRDHGKRLIFELAPGRGNRTKGRPDRHATGPISYNH